MKKKYGKGFPKYTLDGTIKVIEDASKHGRDFSREAFASFGIKGGASPRSGAFIMRLAALTDFGLITQSKGQVTLTDLAWKIVHPESEEERQKSIQEAFLNSEVFSAIYNSSQKNIPLNIDVVGNMAVRQYNITSKYKENFLRNLISSGEDAMLITKIDKLTIQFNSLDSSTEMDKKKIEAPNAGTDISKAERKDVLGKQPVVNQIWGNDEFRIQLSIYSNRPLKAEEFVGIGDVTSKIEELIGKQRQ